MTESQSPNAPRRSDHDIAFLRELRLTDRQQELDQALSRIRSDLQRTYRSALFTVRHSAIPDHCTLAAHQARELMEKLAPALGCMRVEVKQAGQMLGSLMSTYQEHAQPHFGSFVATEPASMPPSVLHYLIESDKTWKWHCKQRSNTGSMIVQLFRNCHQSDPPNQTTIRHYIESWKNLREFFVATAHGRTATAEAVSQNLDALAEILLPLLRPRPIADLEELDALIAEGESND